MTYWKEYKEVIPKKDVLYVIEGLKYRVRKFDDWQGWIHESEDWTEAKMYTLLNKLEMLVRSEWE